MHSTISKQRVGSFKGIRVLFLLCKRHDRHEICNVFSPMQTTTRMLFLRKMSNDTSSRADAVVDLVVKNGEVSYGSSSACRSWCSSNSSRI